MPNDHIRESIRECQAATSLLSPKGGGVGPADRGSPPTWLQPAADVPGASHHVQNRDRSGGECVNVPPQVKWPATLVPHAVTHCAPALAVTLEMAVL